MPDESTQKNKNDKIYIYLNPTPSIVMNEQQRHFHYDQEQGKNAHCLQNYSILQWRCLPVQLDKSIRGIRTGKAVELSVFVDDIIVYLRNVR